MKRSLHHVFQRAVWIVVLTVPFASVLRGEDSQPQDDRVAQLAATIDQQIASKWNEVGVAPAPPADDAEFLRRVYIDIAGTLPPPWTVREFLQDNDPHKRRRVVDELLAGPGYVTNFAVFWRDVLLPDGNTDSDRRLVPSFELWLQRHLVRNTPFDAMVEELLTAPLDAPQDVIRRTAAGDVDGASPVAFFAAKEVNPENLAAATSRSLLGVRIECAQCHDHFFDDWSRKDFWRFAAFFGGIRRQGEGRFDPLREVFDRRELMIPDSQTVVQAGYLDGTRPRWRPREGARETLARWVVAPENPYFARTAANRLWGYFLGSGLVDPVDNISRHNPASHEELLDELAAALVAEEFDLKFLIRAVTASKAYQLSSRQTDPAQADPRLFARMTLRGLSPHQTGRVFRQATGVELEGVELNRLLESGRAAPRDQHTSILLALARMNGPAVTAATSTSASPVLIAVAEFPMPTDERIEALYLATLSRFPTDDERRRMQQYVAGGGARHNERQALADVLWALLNSSEFSVNH